MTPTLEQIKAPGGNVWTNGENELPVIVESIYYAALSEVARLRALAESLTAERDALAARVKALEDAQEWVSVEERLPDERRNWLVWDSGRGNTYCATVDHGEWHIYGPHSGAAVSGVTHWRPLPPPPKGGPTP